MAGREGKVSSPTLAALQIRFCGVRDSVIGKWRDGSVGCGVLHCVGRNLCGGTEKNNGKFREVGCNSSTGLTWHLTEHKCRTFPLK